MKVLGIDPGTATVGFGVVERLAATGRAARLVECGVFRTRAREPLTRRLEVIHAGLVELLDRHRPDVLAVEDIFYATNVRTTVVLGHARGVILLAGAQAWIAVAEYSPALIKKTVVGRGAHVPVGAAIGRNVVIMPRVREAAFGAEKTVASGKTIGK